MDVTATTQSLLAYVEKENFKGYDPYDTLNGWVPFHWLGKWGPAVATQVQKRNPINIRPILGIKKDYNPKGMGLFLKAYCNLYHKTRDKTHLDKAGWIFKWLIANYSRGYSGMAWGYNFPWASSNEFKEAFLPSVVVTAHVVDGIFAFYKMTNDESARQAIISAAAYVSGDIPTTEFDTGISFAYTHQSKGACYNASLHAAEIILKASLVHGEKADDRIEQAVRFVLSKQKADGSWNYSYNPEINAERKQIDFHQGFVLVSLHLIKQYCDFLQEDITQAIKKGLTFYKNEQFLPSGQSLWRLPKKWPAEIHNQAQGIITFSLLKDYHPDYLGFADTIARWTIANMQDTSDFFYYRKYPWFTNKIPFIRWSQAWMLLALSELD
ncbi:prenyltransferase/squalene oxidase repeat-containing protein [Desulfocicer niacini]